MSNLSFKDMRLASFKVLDEAEGIVEAFVSGIGNKDAGDDIVMPGSFDKWLKVRNPKGVWSHDWNRPVSKTLEIREVPPGDPSLPAQLLKGGYGGLYVKTQFNLNTQDGRDAFENVKFYGEESEWSIGFKTHDKEWDNEKKATLLKEIELYEYSPVLFGMNPLTSTASIKAVATEDGVEIDIEGFDAEKSAAILSFIEGLDSEDQVEKTDETEETEVSSEVQLKAVPGSYEERYSILASGLMDEFGDVGYAYPCATFDDKIVYYLYNYKDGSSGYWQASYEIEDGVVTFGTPEAVDIVEVVIAKGVLEEVEKKKLTDTLKAELGVEVDEKSDSIEVKAGRKLSAKNLDRLQTALDAIKAVVDEASTEADDEKGSEPSIQEKIEALVASGKMSEEDAKSLIEDIEAKEAEFLSAIPEAEAKEEEEIEDVEEDDEEEVEDEKVEDEEESEDGDEEEEDEGKTADSSDTKSDETEEPSTEDHTYLLDALKELEVIEAELV